ncbi:MAG: hypothetical protein AMXMBFR58_09620 [Phycisphaerae bacterium]
MRSILNRLIPAFLALATVVPAIRAGTRPGEWDAEIRDVPVRRATVLPNRHEFARVLMGVKTSVVIYAADASAAETSAAAAFDRIAALDECMSDYRVDSELNRLCGRAGRGPVTVSRDLLDVLVTADKVSRATGGLFDVRVGPLVGLWRESRRTGSLAGAQALEKARALAAGSMTIDPAASTVELGLPGMKLDLGGIGKGYAAAAARDVLVAQGMRACMVTMSGDVAVGDAPPGEQAWTIEVATGASDPRRVALPPGHSISTAGDAEQKLTIAGVRYSHIVDPRTGVGSSRRGAAVVAGTDGALVDALDDALYLAGPAEGPAMAAKFAANQYCIEEIAGEGSGRLVRVQTPLFDAAAARADAAWFDPQNVPPAGFEALFNGRDLTNWQGLIDGPPVTASMKPDALAQAQERANASMSTHWSVQDGELVFDGRGDSLQTARHFRDFELFVDWKIQAGGDSGIYLRGTPQVQIWDNPIGSGGLYNNQTHRSRPLAVADRPVGEWNRFHIIVRGDHVTVFLNDTLVVNDTVLENYWEPGRALYAAGPIELQNHGNQLRFKNIFVRELPPLPEAADPDGFRMGWWREARFGMFIHWGLYAIPAGVWNGKDTPGIGEWIMHDLQIPVAEYEPLAAKFNPTRFDAEAWVKAAADAGVRYIVITTKHHDGFCLFNSDLTTYDIMDASPFKRDIMKELSEACRRHGIRMCWYHSIWDWHHPDAQSAATFTKYEQVLRGQVTELLTRYGPIGAMWFDGEWDRHWTNDMGKSLYDLCRQIQPWTIVNNRVGKGRQGMAGHTAAGDFPGDFGTPEQEIPATGLPGQDWESCMTMNDTWGFKSKDHNWKSPQTLVRMLIETTSKGGNFLLNVGPTAEGEIPQPSLDRLAEVGRWMKLNNRSIYGAGPSPFRELPWGRCTSRDGTLYLHVFDMPADGTLVVPGLLNAVTSARLLASGHDLPASRTSAGWAIDVRGVTPDPYSTVIALAIEGTPAVVDLPIMPDADGSFTLKAADALLAGPAIKLEGRGDDANAGFWTDEQATVSWTISGVTPGRYGVELLYACPEDSKGATYDIRIGSSLVSGEVFGTQGWRDYISVPVGDVELTDRTCTVVVTPTSKPGQAVMNLRNLRLIPAK